MTGDVIRGIIIITQKDDFMGTDITLGLYGAEFTEFRKIATDRGTNYCKKFIFLNASQIVH